MFFKSPVTIISTIVFGILFWWIAHRYVKTHGYLIPFFNRSRQEPEEPARSVPSPASPNPASIPYNVQVDHIKSFILDQFRDFCLIFDISPDNIYKSREIAAFLVFLWPRAASKYGKNPLVQACCTMAFGSIYGNDYRSMNDFIDSRVSLYTSFCRNDFRPRRLWSFTEQPARDNCLSDSVFYAFCNILWHSPCAFDYDNCPVPLRDFTECIEFEESVVNALTALDRYTDEFLRFMEE